MQDAEAIGAARLLGAPRERPYRATPAGEQRDKIATFQLIELHLTTTRADTGRRISNQQGSVSGLKAIVATSQVVGQAALRPSWVIRDRLEPAAGPAVSAMPPKAEVKSGHWRHRPGPSRVDDAVVGVIQARTNPHWPRANESTP